MSESAQTDSADTVETDTEKGTDENASADTGAAAVEAANTQEEVAPETTEDKGKETPPAKPDTIAQHDKKTPYRVLARKYRPQNFDQLIGQEALVRTLKNAIESGRIAQAYMLTGIRGTGKTTTARIIAKALNYRGPDGNGEPTIGSTDDCETCRAITEDRHPDVMEMDAASRTGVEDIREILDGVRYAPTSARYKVYIIDEIHMLSKAAFNALLKTLEEPPEHVIFIFATTEIRKVPVTVLSRCQRFDLRRVDIATLSDYYKQICEKEGVTCEDEAMSLIARAADGSVRDGLSLLDQAIALSNGQITAEQIQDMLGLADRTRILDILDHSLQGKPAEALAVLDDLHKAGADPATVVRDMLDFSHLMTRLKAAPNAGETSAALSTDLVKRLTDLSVKLSMPTLGKTWQILLKGIEEMNYAPSQQAAAEMIIIRLAYAADLPDPGDLIKKLKDSGSTQAGSSAAGQASSSVAGAGATAKEPVHAELKTAGGASAAVAMQPAPQAVADNGAETEGETIFDNPQTLADVEYILNKSGRIRLAGEVFQAVHLVHLEPGRLDIRLEPGARKEIYNELSKSLNELTGNHWLVSPSDKDGSLTLAEQRAAEEKAVIESLKQDPLVENIVQLFPGAEVKLHNPD